VERQVDGGLGAEGGSRPEESLVRGPGSLRPLAIHEQLVEGRPTAGDLGQSDLPQTRPVRGFLPTGEALASADHRLARDRRSEADARMLGPDPEGFLQLMTARQQEDRDRFVGLGRTDRGGGLQGFGQGPEWMMGGAVAPEIGIGPDPQHRRREGPAPQGNDEQQRDPTHGACSDAENRARHSNELGLTVLVSYDTFDPYPR
jgi:hypothetical protein